MARTTASAFPDGPEAALPPLAQLARRIRTLRADRRLTQEEFAGRAGISVSFVSMLERGERSPSYETLLQLAAGLDVTPCELFLENVDDGANAPYARLLGRFVRDHRLSRSQIERLLRVAGALFDVEAEDPPVLPIASPRRELRRCGAEGCERPVLARGLCSAHYHAERRNRARA